MGHPDMRNGINHGGDERHPRAPRQPGKGASMISRRAQTVIVSVMAGIFIISGGVSGVAFAEAHQYHLRRSTSACASRPAAAARLVPLVTTKAHAASSPSPSPRPSPNPRPSPSPRPIPSPAATSSPSPTASPKPSTSPKPTASPKPSTSPSPAASPSTTPTPRKSPKPTPRPNPKPGTEN